MYIWRSFQLKTTASASLKVNGHHCLVNSTSLYDLISLGPPVPVNDQSENVFVLDIKTQVGRQSEFLLCSNAFIGQSEWVL